MTVGTMSEGFFGGLLMGSLQGVILAALILAVQWTFRNQLSARWKHALWWLLVLRLLLPTTVNTSFSIYNLLPRESLEARRSETVDALANVRSPVVDMTTASNASEQPMDRGFEFDQTPIDRVEPASVLLRDTRSPVRPEFRDSLSLAGATSEVLIDVPREPASLAHWMLMVWLGGVVVLSGVVTWGSFRFSRQLARSEKRRLRALDHLLNDALARMGVHASVEIVESNAVSSPVLYGFRRFQILLPVGFTQRFSESELRHVILHELAHIRRRDLWVNWVVTALQTVHWFNPVVWFAFGRMRADRELACDELALWAAREESASAYGRTIIKLLEGFSRASTMPGLVGILEDKQQMRRRIRMIAEFKRPGRWSALAAVLVGALATVTLTDAQSAKSEAGDEREQGEFDSIDLNTTHDQANLLREVGTMFGIDWGKFPRGELTVAGVPFDVSGVTVLAGSLLHERLANTPRSIVEGIAVDRVAEHVHLLHGVTSDDQGGALTAMIRLNYEDGTWAVIPITFGNEAASIRRLLVERLTQLGENTELAWTSEISDVSYQRLFASSFPNPNPEKTISTLSLQAGDSVTSEVVFGITVGRSRTADELAQWERLVEPAQTADSQLSFRLVQGASLSPVADATIRARGQTGIGQVDLGSVETDESGIARFAYDTSLRTLTVSIDDERFEPVSATWYLHQGQAVPETYSLKAEPVVTWSGRYVDEAGDPVVGAEVRVSQSSGLMLRPNGEEPRVTYPSQKTVTDSDGRWSLVAPRLGGRRVSLRVDHPMFIQRSVQVVGQSDASDSNSVGETELVAGTFQNALSSGYPVTTIVTDSNGRPIPNAEVQIANSTSHSDLRWGTTDISGVVLVAGVPGSTTIVTVQAEGYAPAYRRIDPETHVEPLEFQLEPGHIYRGVIQDTEGHPIEGVTIRVSEWNGVRVLDRGTQTDADGVFFFDSLPATGISLFISKSGHVVKRDVRPLSGGFLNEIVLPEATVIRGSVVDAETGRPIPEFLVSVGEKQLGFSTPPNWRDYLSVQGEQGQFAVDLVETREGFAYILKIEADGYETALSDPYMTLDGSREVEFRLRRGSALAGVVVDAQGNPAAGVTVGFVSGHQRLFLKREGFHVADPRSAPIQVTDSNGRFSFNSHPEARLLAAATSDAYGEVDCDPDRTEYVVQLAPLGRIEGRLQVAGPTLYPHEILISHQGLVGDPAVEFDFSTFSTDVADDGTFSISGIPAGRRHIVWLFLESPKSRRHAMSQEVEVIAGESVRAQMNVEGTVVVGTVTLSEADVPTLWDYASVSTIPPEPPGTFGSREELDAWLNSPEYQEYTQAARTYGIAIHEDGRFMSAPIPAGTYRFSISGKDRSTIDEYGWGGTVIGSHSQEITIEPGEEVLDLGEIIVPMNRRLTVGDPAPWIDGVDPSGNPVLLSDFEGRRVLAFPSSGIQVNEMQNLVSQENSEFLNVLKASFERGSGVAVFFIERGDMEAIAQSVDGFDLPFVIVGLSREELAGLSKRYRGLNGLPIVGPDGRIEYVLQPSDTDGLARQLEKIF